MVMPSPVILTNHLGYERAGTKRAVVQGTSGDDVRSGALLDADHGERVADCVVTNVGAVAKWKDWRYWTLEFSEVQREGRFVLSCATGAGEIRSFPFDIHETLLERHTLSDVIQYFKGQRCTGLYERFDHAVPLEGRTEQTVDARGGWYDATGDYGKYMSHLSFSTYHNPQQANLTAWALLLTYDLLKERNNPNFRQMLRRIQDEAGWGADWLARMKAPGGSFYRAVAAPGAEKKPEDRRIEKDATGFVLHDENAKTMQWPLVGSRDDSAYQASFRSGGGVAIAALARAAAAGVPGELTGQYLKAAEEGWAFLSEHNRLFTNDGQENIVDDYCALLAATELYAATQKPAYKEAADGRARRLVGRLAPAPRAYWRSDDDDRPFYHAADSGLPVVSLLSYAGIASASDKAAVLAAVRASLEWELAVTAEVANPFGYARQLVQTRDGVRETRFFYPHDANTAPWWQGENARLGSLATAARLALPHFAGDAAFAARLDRYAQDQLNWILGGNPYDASMMRGNGRNNPEYLYFNSWEYTSRPGGITNGITAGLGQPHGIDFLVPFSVTGADNDWRWAEQWLPHATWYMLAVAAGRR
jgi:Glycosyl hydrolase family 9/Cellulase N-terminal ig-like domain